MNRKQKVRKVVQERLTQESHRAMTEVLRSVEGVLSLPIEVRSEGWKPTLMGTLSTVTAYLRDERNPALDWASFPLTRDFYMGHQEI